MAALRCFSARASLAPFEALTHALVAVVYAAIRLSRSA